MFNSEADWAFRQARAFIIMGGPFPPPPPTTTGLASNDNEINGILLLLALKNNMKIGGYVCVWIVLFIVCNISVYKVRRHVKKTKQKEKSVNKVRDIMHREKMYVDKGLTVEAIWSSEIVRTDAYSRKIITYTTVVALVTYTMTIRRAPFTGRTICNERFIMGSRSNQNLLSYC